MPDWLASIGWYLLIPALCLVASLVLVWWGLWGSRSKGRPRCPVCWRDMRDSLPTARCPACGYAIGAESCLYRNRRRRGALWLAVILVVPWIYPPFLISGWCGDQSALAALQQRGHFGPDGAVAVPMGPQFLIKRLPTGIACFFERVKAVSFAPAADDADLALCARLVKLEHLNLPQAQVTDAGLAHIKGLVQLTRLIIPDTKVTDAGLAHVAGLPQLNAVDLDRTLVTDAGLVHFPGMAILELISLRDTQITGAGFAHLTKLPRLGGLHLAGTKINDAGLAHVGKMTHMMVLELERTQVTDAGLAHLHGLSELRSLRLSNTKATYVGVHALERAIPGLKVFW